MHISIAERFKPFSHLPGSKCILPGTNLGFQIFPALISVFDIELGIVLEEIPLDLTGPTKDFNVQLDLEKMLIRVFGESQEGFYRYLIRASEKGYAIDVEKGDLSISSPKPIKLGNHCERLSLGNNKSQDIEMIRRRLQMEEIMPLWFRLGQIIPAPKYVAQPNLIENCRAAIMLESPEILEYFQALYLAGTESLLCPRSLDVENQGFIDPPTTGSPMSVLHQGYLLIRSLFIYFEENTLDILPFLPKEFHAGRMLHLNCGNIGYIDLEWSKKSLRRLIFTAREDASIRFNFQKHLKECRLTYQNKTEKFSNFQKLKIEKNCQYFFDNFKK